MDIFEAGVAPDDAVVPVSAAPPERLRFEFHGSVAEYFRIWIVNLALTLATLGIYSAWAKVRRLKYLHSHTVLAGSAFGYHGDPIAILKGRAVAAALFVAYVVAGMVSDGAAALAGIVFGAAMPWLVVKSLKFRLRMTSWRGIRFDFDENFGEAYKIYLGWGALATLTLGLLAPAFIRRLHRFTVGHAAYGSTYFECDPPLRPIVFAVLRAVLVLIAALFVLFTSIIVLAGNVPEDDVSPLLQLLPLFVLLFAYPIAFGFFNAGVLNAVYGHSTLGPHRLASDLGGLRLAGIYVTNLLAIVASLGLLIPWATIRLLRYRLDTLSVDAAGSIDEFVASQAASQPRAVGEEIADVFDVDFGL